MKKEYKVLEVVWLPNNEFQEEYCETFKTFKEAQRYIYENTSEWENDLHEYAKKGIDIKIETWEGGKLINTYTAWCKGGLTSENEGIIKRRN